MFSELIIYLFSVFIVLIYSDILHMIFHSNIYIRNFMLTGYFEFNQVIYILPIRFLIKHVSRDSLHLDLGRFNFGFHS